MPSRLRSLTIFGLGCGLLVGGCFDSDEVFRVAEDATTTMVAPMTTATMPGTSTGDPATVTTEEPELTCRGGLQCILDCALQIAMDQNPEPNLGCILVCTEERGMTDREVYHLFRLANCAADECATPEVARCDMGDEGTTGVMGTGSGTGTGTGTAGTTTGGGAGLEAADGGGIINDCLLCMFQTIQEADPGVCEEFQELCV